MHKLTDLIFKTDRKDITDKTITDWLKEKAEQLSVLESNTSYSNKFFHQILGLKEKTLEEKFYTVVRDSPIPGKRLFCADLAQIAKDHYDSNR